VVPLLPRASGGAPLLTAADREPMREAGGDAPTASPTLVSRACTRLKKYAQSTDRAANSFNAKHQICGCKIRHSAGAVPGVSGTHDAMTLW